jgi:hypothetical protein
MIIRGALRMRDERGSGAGVAVGALCVVLGMAALCATLQFLPVGTCDLPFGIPHALMALAQSLGLLGIVSLRRGGVGDGGALALAVAWGLLSACALGARGCAGDLAALGGNDAVYGVGGGLALLLLLHGLGGRLREAGSGGLLLGVVMAALAGAGSAKLEDGLVQQRMIETFGRLKMVDGAIASYAARAGGPPHHEAVDVAALLPELVPAEAPHLPTMDAWGRPLRYERRGAAGWTLTSLGAMGKPGPSSEGASRDYVDDLVMRDGSPFAWPEVPCSGKPRLPHGASDGRRLPRR